MRLIDADLLRQTIESRIYWGVGLLEGIDDAPAVDAVEVVRCKDCKHKKHLQGARDEAIVCGLGWGLSGIIAEEDFCSYGKRRADDD